MAKVYVRDNMKAFEKAINELRLHQVLIGIPEKNTERKEEPGEESFDKMSNAQIGYIQEFGSERMNIPPRPFLIPGIREAQDELVEKLRDGLIKTFIDPNEAKNSLKKAGIIGANWVKSWITSGIGMPDLSQATLKARRDAGFKGTKPLIHTGQLRNSITYVMDEK